MEVPGGLAGDGLLIVLETGLLLLALGGTGNGARLTLGLLTGLGRALLEPLKDLGVLEAHDGMRPRRRGIIRLLFAGLLSLVLLLLLVARLHVGGLGAPVRASARAGELEASGAPEHTINRTSGTTAALLNPGTGRASSTFTCGKSPPPGSTTWPATCPTARLSMPSGWRSADLLRGEQLVGFEVAGTSRVTFGIGRAPREN